MLLSGPRRSLSVGDSTTPVAWTSLVNTTASGNLLTKTSGGSVFNGSSSSPIAIQSGDGYIEWTVTDVSGAYQYVAGLSSDVVFPTPALSVIGYGLYVAPVNGAGQMLGIVEGGVQLTPFVGGTQPYTGTVVVGDRLRVAVVNGTVKYSKNGVVIYTSATPPTYPLFGFATFYEVGGSISNTGMQGASALMGPTPTTVTWASLVNTSASGGTITKISGGAAFNASGTTTKSLAGAGYLEWTVTDASASYQYVMGLTHSTSGSDASNIDFGIYVVPAAGVGQSLGILEGGTQLSVFGGGNPMYTGNIFVGDKLRVAVVGGAVQYSLNGSVFYTSLVAPTFPLFGKNTFYEVGGSAGNATMLGAT